MKKFAILIMVVISCGGCSNRIDIPDSGRVARITSIDQRGPTTRYRTESIPLTESVKGSNDSVSSAYFTFLSTEHYNIGDYVSITINRKEVNK